MAYNKLLNLSNFRKVEFILLGKYLIYFIINIFICLGLGSKTPIGVLN